MTIRPTLRAARSVSMMLTSLRWLVGAGALTVAACSPAAVTSAPQSNGADAPDAEDGGTADDSSCFCDCDATGGVVTQPRPAVACGQDAGSDAAASKSFACGDESCDLQTEYCITVVKNLKTVSSACAKLPDASCANDCGCLGKNAGSVEPECAGVLQSCKYREGAQTIECHP